MRRAQSHVVGVALMLSLTVLALGLITAGIGGVFQAQTANADAQRVANDLETALQPVTTTGSDSARLAFGGGRLDTEPRQLRVVRDDTIVAEVDVDALVFTANERRVSFLSGAIVRGRGESAWLARDPPVAASNGSGVLAVSAPALNASGRSVAGGGTTTLRTNVSHDRRQLGRGTFAVVLETETPKPVETYFEAQNATTARRDFDGDGIPSVVATYPGTRTGYLVVHDMRLEVDDG